MNPEQSEEAEPVDDAVVDVEAALGWIVEREVLRWGIGVNQGRRRGLTLNPDVFSCHPCAHVAHHHHRHRPP